MECFICLQGTGTLLQPCQCNSYVHAECLMRLVQTVPSHAGGCPICKTSYEGIVMRETLRCVMIRNAWIIFLFYAIVLSMCIGYTILLYEFQRAWYAALLGGIFGSVCCLLAVFHRTLWRQTGHWCCAYPIRVGVPVVV